MPAVSGHQAEHPLAGLRGGIRPRIVLIILVHAVVVSLAARNALAQNRPEIMSLPPEASGYIRMGGVHFDNFYQLPDGLPHPSMWAGVLEVRVEEHLGSDGGFRAYTRADLFQFQQRGLSPGVLGGFRHIQGINRFDVSLAAQWNRPRFDSGDTPEQANIFIANGGYTLAVRSLEVSAMAESVKRCAEPPFVLVL